MHVIRSLYICRVPVAVAISLLHYRAKKFITDWLPVLPLQHFLNGRCKPFDKPEMDPKALLESWRITITDIHLDELRSKLEVGYVRNEYQYCKYLPSSLVVLLYYAGLFRKCLKSMSNSFHLTHFFYKSLSTSPPRRTSPLCLNGFLPFSLPPGLHYNLTWTPVDL